MVMMTTMMTTIDGDDKDINDDGDDREDDDERVYGVVWIVFCVVVGCNIFNAAAVY